MSVAKQKLVEIPPEELDSLLCNFYITAKKKDNSEYEPDTMFSFSRVAIPGWQQREGKHPQGRRIQGIERSPEIQTPGTQEAG